MTWKQLEQNQSPEEEERARRGREAIMIVKGGGTGRSGEGREEREEERPSGSNTKGDAVVWDWRDFRRWSPRVRVRRDGAGGSVSERQEGGGR